MSILDQIDDAAARAGGRAAYEAAHAAGKTILPYRLWAMVRTPDFKAWYGDWEAQPDLPGIHKPTGEPRVSYRGEWGMTGEVVNTRRGSITFGGRSDANLYATDPNDLVDYPWNKAGHLIPAFVRLQRPVINTPDDPFIDFSVIEKALGRDAAIRIAMRHQQYVMETDYWYENYSESALTFDLLLLENPDVISELYCIAHPLFDDPVTVAEFAAAGFDGAIHGPYGGTHGEELDADDLDQVEFKLFHAGQARSTLSPDLLLGPVPPRLSEPLPEQRVAASRGTVPEPAPSVVVAAPPVRPQAIGNMGWLRPADVEEELRENGLGSLVDNGGIVIHRSGDSLPGTMRMKRGIAGVAHFDTGTIHINAGAHNYRDRPMATILHEAFHARVEPLLGSKRWCKLMDRLALMYERAKAGELRGPYWKAALARVNEAKGFGDAPQYAVEVEEFGAYALDKYESAPPIITRWVRDLTGTVKAWALTRFGVQLGDVTPAQLHKLAKSALKATRIGSGIARSYESLRAAAAMGPTSDQLQHSAARQANGLRVTVSGYSGLVSPNAVPGDKPWRVTWYAGEPGASKAIGNVAIEDAQAARLARGESASIDLPDWTLFIDPDEGALERQTDSPAFKAWFADSKAVDEDGQPMVVYHGTANDFDVFAPSSQGTYGTGMYFANTRKSAEVYLPGVDGNERVIESYLSLQNPWVVDAEFDSPGAAIEDLDSPIVEAILTLPRGREILDETKRNSRLGMYSHFSDSLQAHLRELGHDGVIARYSDGSMELVAFDPEQIKSASDNVGAFDPADPNMYARRAYHGSPHEFGEFTLEKVGSGEGVQAYGWGLYFAGRREVAEWYHKNLAQVTPAHNTFDGKRITKAMHARLRNDPDPAVADFFGSKAANRASGIVPLRKALDDKIEFVQEQLDIYRERLERRLASAVVGATYGADDYRDMISHLEGRIRGLEGLRMRIAHVPQQRRGAVYEVDIPDDDEYLDWDSPLSEQSETVRMALEADGFRLDGDPTGEEVYRVLSRRFAAQAREAVRDGIFIEDTHDWGQRKASEAFAAMGIAGIKYLDGVSRDQGYGERNYVVFDDARVSLAPGSMPERLRIDGKLRPTRNSAGNLIHPDAAGIRNFWSWFGDSRHVDGKGRPLVAYHGTTKDFEVFDPSLSKSTGIFFSAGTEYASIVAQLDGAREGAGKVMPVYLRTSNPKVIPGSEFTHASTREALAAGHDALITLDEQGEPSQITVFDSLQIKSALGNSGEFSSSAQSILARRAWHGSSEHFIRFSTSHVGTGEGNQSFGWGLYFSDSREVAEFYRRTVSGERGYAFDGETGLTRAEVMDRVDARFGTAYLDGVIKPCGIADRVMDDLLYASRADMPERYLPGTERRAMVEQLRELITRPTPGSLYEVDIPEDDEYLLWDKPLSQQPEPVRAALLAAGISLPDHLEPLRLHNGQFFYRGAVLTDDGDGWFHDKAGRYTGMAKGLDKMVELVDYKAGPVKESELPKGSTLYADISVRLGGDQAASEYLCALGVAGIKYLDGLHRAAGEGQHNFVVFDGDAIAIRSPLWSGSPEEYDKASTLLGGAMPTAEQNKLRADNYLLQVKTQSAAFADIGVSVEMARILREAASRAEGGLKEPRLSLTDLNGARVGYLLAQSMPPDAAILPGRVRLSLGGDDQGLAQKLRSMADALDRGVLPDGLEVGDGVDLFAGPVPSRENGATDDWDNDSFGRQLH